MRIWYSFSVSSPLHCIVVSWPRLFAMGTHNKVFWCKVKIQKIPSTQNWWFCSCDRCFSGATEDGDAFKFSEESCTSRGTSPRYKLGVKAVMGILCLTWFS